MRKILFGLLLAALSTVCPAQTFKVQNLQVLGTFSAPNGDIALSTLSPTGSTSGQAIVSTGGASAPAWGNVSAATLSGVTQFDVAVGASPGLGFVSPGTAGGILTSNGTSAYPSFQSSIANTVTLTGVTGSGTAAAGNVGEIIKATGTGVSLTSGIVANITSIPLTAGDWDVWGNIYFNPAGTTTQSQIGAGISTTSATLPAIPNYSVLTISIPAGNVESQIAPTQDLHLASTTTVYLTGFAVFATSTETATGTIFARRRR